MASANGYLHITEISEELLGGRSKACLNWNIKSDPIIERKLETLFYDIILKI
jgi:hypothetical protein